MKSVASLVALMGLLSLAQAQPYAQMDYGPFISATFTLPFPPNNVAMRGVAVSFKASIDGEEAPKQPEPKDKGKKNPPTPDLTRAGLIFDTELLRVAGYWHGGFVTFKGVAFDGNHGSNPSPAGTVQVGTRTVCGWSTKGEFDDPRAIPHGPLPRERGKYRGLYRHENGIVFSYTVAGVDILDMPTIEVVDNQRIYARTLEIAPRQQELSVLIAQVPGVKEMTNVGVMHMVKANDLATIANFKGGPKGTALAAGVENFVLKIPASAETTRIKVGVWKGAQGSWEAGAKTLDKVAGPINLAELTKGGKTRFEQPEITKGVRGEDKGAYVIDSITPPFNNAFKSWLRFGGFDFLKDGKAAISTWSGDVWTVSGIDDTLEKLTWKRIASGLFQPLGLKIVDDKIHTLGRDGLMRLHDLNGDGEIDFYECLNNDFMVTQNFHEFIFDLHTDPEGNFYFIKGGPVRPGGSGWDKLVPHHGCIFKVSKDGSKLEVVARGFRAPNGMGVGPKGEITSGDNEGTWTPTCPINWIKPGGFYGVPDFAEGKEKPKVRDNPLCWLPRDIDNSNGGQVWITGDKFGPLSGQMLHTSYGVSTLYQVLKEDVGGQMQGGVVPLLKFDSGVCRARFQPNQNALFLTGLRGWQTNASKDAGFYRVRYTGKKAYLPSALHAKPAAIEITFSDPLDKSVAEDVDNYNVEQWLYKWTQGYGSPQFKVSNPKQQGHDQVEVEEAKLSADGKTVTLKINSLRPVMQMKIRYSLKSADGQPVRSAIHNTINVVGNLRGEVHPGEYRVVPYKQ